jgi:anti-sigma B factor antagonist
VDENLILVACRDQIAYLKVIGKGSFKNAKLVKTFYEAALRDGATRIIFDLDQCIHMDSTFMGVLAAVAAEQKRMDYANPMIINLSPRNRELLETLGLDRILDTPPEAPEEIGSELTRLQEGEESTKEEAAKTMLEAHEKLIDLDERNRSKFRDVVDYLRDKLESEKE